MQRDQEQLDDTKQDLARERTDWAYDRTVFARERTYSAWVRTGLASVAAGLGVARLLRSLDPRWMVYALSALLICIGGVTFGLSFWRYRQPLDQEDRGARRGAPTWLIGALTLGLLAAAGLALWLLE